jgi:hypothetical protein
MSRSDAAADPDAIVSYLTTTHPETVVATAMSAWFFSLDPSNFPNYATIVTTDDHDRASNLSREGVFRLNVGVGKDTFERLVGDRLASDELPDSTVLDRWLPHPVYGAQRWVSIVNPSAETFEQTAKPLPEGAHARLARQQALRGRTG